MPGPVWIAITEGFLCDPTSGEVVEKDGVLYWRSENGMEWALNLSPAALTEAARRNQARPIGGK